MKISPLSHLSNNYNSTWGRNGYTTAHVLDVTSAHQGPGVVFKLQEATRPYEKKYDSSPAYIHRLNEIIRSGHSLGAYDNGTLIGVLICEPFSWNNTVHIEHMLVAEQYRKTGVGQSLLQQLIAHCGQHNYRLISLETQNTNLPAIKFYLKNSFVITGINTALYDGSSAAESAVFMACHNKNFQPAKANYTGR